MNMSTIFEIIGYVGSALVLLSFMMVSVYKLRVINMIGSIVCVIYGVLIHAYPTVVMNVALVCINIYNLYKMRSSTKNYDLVRVSEKDSLVNYTIDLYKEDIAKCFPGISMDFAGVNCGFVVCHKGTPAGILLGKLKESTLDIKLDYSTPEYRDFSIGEFLMSNLVNEGIDKLVYKGSDQHHKQYLARTGFVDKGEYYERTL